MTRVYVNTCYTKFLKFTQIEHVMTNLTISLDEAVVRGARIRAIQEGTSLSAKVRDFLRQYVEGTATQEAQLRQAATERLMHNIAKATQASAPTEASKTEGGTLRDAMYAEDFRLQASAVASAKSL